MKKNKFKSILMIAVLCLSSSTVLTPLSANAQEVDKNENSKYDGQFFYLEQNGNSIFILDKETGEAVTLEIEGESKASARYSDGTIVSYFTDSDGNVYENGNLVKPAPDIYIEPQRGANIMRRSGEYHYLYTTYSNTYTEQRLQNIIFSILGFLPVVDQIMDIASAVDAFKSLSKPMMYTKTDVYYIDGYSRYKYVTYYYSDPQRTKLVRVTTTYRQMW